MDYQVNMQHTESVENNHSDRASDGGQSDSALDADLARDDARTIMKNLGQRVYSITHEPEVQGAYLMAAEMTFLSTIGRTMWRFMTDTQAQHQIKVARNESEKEGCPDDAKRLIEVGVERLNGIDRKNIVYSADDQDESGLAVLQEAVDETTQQLLKLIFNGFTRYKPTAMKPEEKVLLRKVDELTSMHIGIAIKLRLGVLAKTTWPTSGFPTTSEILKQFYTEFTDQLKVDGLYHGVETGKFSCDLQDGTASNTSTRGPAPGEGTASQNVSGRTNDTGVTGPAAALPTGVINNLGPYHDIFEGSFEKGTLSFYTPVRTLNLQNDNIASIIINKHRHVQEVYEAIRTLPAQADYHQREMILSFQKKIGQLNRPEVTLLECSYMIVKALIDLHTDGDHLRPDQIEQIRPTKDDQMMVAVERMMQIVDILQNTKRICIDVLNGLDRITMFVAAPLACDKRKSMNKNNNTNKAVGVARGRAALQAQRHRGTGAAAQSPAVVRNPLLTQGDAASQGLAFAYNTAATHVQSPFQAPDIAPAPASAPGSAENTVLPNQFASSPYGYAGFPPTQSQNFRFDTFRQPRPFSSTNQFPQHSPQMSYGPNPPYDVPHSTGSESFRLYASDGGFAIPQFPLGYAQDSSYLGTMRTNRALDFGEEASKDDDEDEIHE